MSEARIGTAGWSLNAEHRKHAEGDGSHLQRYAGVFDCVEIDSSFYRPHQAKTYARWAASVPADFRFAVKLPKAITHEAKLADTGPALDEYLAGVRSLGDKLGPLIVQLAPSLAFDAGVAAAFFADFRTRHAGAIVCEPRHATWFTPEADALLATQRIARVAADPVLHAGADVPGGWRGLAYFRLHGSPETYRSKYGEDIVHALAARLAALGSGGIPVWVIFDNTMLGHAFFDALALKRRLASAA